MSSLGGSKIDQLLPMASAAQRAHLTESLGSGAVLPGLPAQAVQATHIAYVYALQTGLRVGAGVALLGSMLAWMLVSPRLAGARAPAAQRTGQPGAREQHAATGAPAAEPTGAEALHV